MNALNDYFFAGVWSDFIKVLDFVRKSKSQSKRKLDLINKF